MTNDVPKDAIDEAKRIDGKHFNKDGFTIKFYYDIANKEFTKDDNLYYYDYHYSAPITFKIDISDEFLKSVYPKCLDKAVEDKLIAKEKPSALAALNAGAEKSKAMFGGGKTAAEQSENVRKKQVEVL